MITTKTCSTCEHFPNDHHCVGCVWDEDKGENTKWELKKNPIVIERAVLDKIRAKIEEPLKINEGMHTESAKAQAIALSWCIEIIDKYRNEVSE